VVCHFVDYDIEEFRGEGAHVRDGTGWRGMLSTERGNMSGRIMNHDDGRSLSQVVPLVNLDINFILH
jgi:hypothetical protein